VDNLSKEFGFVSVIVPIYNVEGYLEQCLNSLCAQTWERFEVILVNDGSTDGSANIAAHFATDQPVRFRFFSKDNGGLSSARNFGLSKARGEYVAFVDADDWVHKDFLFELLRAIMIAGADVAVCAYSANYADGRVEIFPGVDNCAKDAKRQAFLGPTFACNKLFRKQLFNLVVPAFIEGICYEDVGTVPLLIARAKSIGVTNLPLYQYRIGRPGAITTFRDRRLLDFFVSVNRLKVTMPPGFFDELEWMTIRLCVSRFAILSNVRDGACLQQAIYTFLRENFPCWRRNKYLWRERRFSFLMKALMLGMRLGFLLRLKQKFLNK